jgi:hypothetical protein
MQRCSHGASPVFWKLAIAVGEAEKSKKPPDLGGCGGCLREPSFRQLAAAPELRRSPSAEVTTTTTLPTSKPIDDACSEERIEPKVEEAGIEMRNLLPTFGFVKRVYARISEFIV